MVTRTDGAQWWLHVFLLSATNAIYHITSRFSCSSVTTDLASVFLFSQNQALVRKLRPDAGPQLTTTPTKRRRSSAVGPYQVSRMSSYASWVVCGRDTPARRPTAGAAAAQAVMKTADHCAPEEASCDMELDRPRCVRLRERRTTTLKHCSAAYAGGGAAWKDVIHRLSHRPRFARTRRYLDMVVAPSHGVLEDIPRGAHIGRRARGCPIW